MSGLLAARCRHRDPVLIAEERTRLEKLRDTLVDRGYEAVVDVDTRSRGWVLRVASPRTDLPTDLRCMATLLVWCRRRSQSTWQFEWPYGWPISCGEDLSEATAFVERMQGSPQPTGRDR